MKQPVRAYEQKIFDRINPAVRFSVTRYVLIIGFFVAVFLFGLVSTANLGVDLLPTVNIPVVQVNTGFPGAEPSVVDLQVSQVVENAVSSLSGINGMTSTSGQGSSRVVLSFDPSTDKNAAANQVAALVASAAKSFPNGTTAPIIQTFDPNSLPVVQFGVISPTSDLLDVGTYLQNILVPQLQRIGGVANVQIDGAPTREFEVLLDPNRLASLGLTPQQVKNAILNSAISKTIGTVVSKGKSIAFATKNQPSTSADIGSILVDPARAITVGALADVRDTTATTAYARVNSVPVVLVSIQKTTDSNSVAVVQGVRDALKATTLPPGYELEYSNDTTGPIKASIESTYHELFLTAVVVAIICLLFLGKLNTALSVIIAIPIALSASPILYSLAGFNFNLVSLLALIVAIGIVVDDSIVVTENVERYRHLGFSLKDSVFKGASEVFSAVVASTLSLLSVLLPVAFLGGFVGRYIIQFSLGLSAAVLFSLVEAVLFLTVRLAYTPEARTFDWSDFRTSFVRLPKAVAWGLRSTFRPLGLVVAAAGLAALIVFQSPWWWYLGLLLVPGVLSIAYFVGYIVLTGLQAATMTGHNLTERGLTWVRDHYVRLLNGTFRRGVWVLGSVGVFFVATLVFIGPSVPFIFVPQTDGGTLQVNVRFPANTPIEVTNQAVGVLEAWLLKQPEINTVQALVGSGSASGSASSANILVQLVPVEQRASVFRLIPAYRKTLGAQLRGFENARVSVSAGGGFRGQGTTVSYTLTAPDFNRLTAVNDRVIEYLQNNPAVADVASDLSNTTLENDFWPDNEKLSLFGIAANDVADTLQIFTSGVQASNVLVGGQSYPIQVMADPKFIVNTQSLQDLPVYSPTLSTSVNVRQLGSFHLSNAPIRMDRTNRIYSTVFDVNMAPGAPTDVVFLKQITDDMTAMGILTKGMGFGPEQHFSAGALASQLAVQGPLAFLLALFLAYLVMGAQFNSWRYPVYLLLPVPLALVGALWLIWVLGVGLDIFGLLGMLMLIGLSAKNAILYLDFVVERLGTMPFREALIESAQLRFRPIVMTTLTVLVISFPLIFGQGQGSEYGQKMGIVMLGGILSSAILTFFVVPTAFFLFERKRNEPFEPVFLPPG